MCRVGRAGAIPEKEYFHETAYLLTELENIEIASVNTLDLLTRNGNDSLTLNRLDATKGRISGTSGVNPFIPITWSATPLLYAYTSNGDTASSTNTTIVNSGALQVPGLKKFTYSGGAGHDFLQVTSATAVTSSTAAAGSGDHAGLVYAGVRPVWLREIARPVRRVRPGWLREIGRPVRRVRPGWLREIAQPGQAKLKSKKAKKSALNLWSKL